jgi:hypothetical protein
LCQRARRSNCNEPEGTAANHGNELPVDKPQVLLLLLHSDVPFILNYYLISHIAFLSVRPFCRRTS